MLPGLHSVVLRLKKWVAAGAATARITAEQITAAATGCCIGHAWIVPDGLGFPHSTRVPATTALTGFQVVIAWSQPGMCWVGIRALETKARGRSRMKPKPPYVAGSSVFDRHGATGGQNG